MAKDQKLQRGVPISLGQELGKTTRQGATLHLLGIDHERLTYKFQGRYFRLTDVHGRVVNEILA